MIATLYLATALERLDGVLKGNGGFRRAGDAWLAESICREGRTVVTGRAIATGDFARAYDEDGYTREEYNTHPALVKTHEAFSKATNEMVAFADGCLKGNCKA